eukprot:3962339-Karenia_brevis.AAC.1
MLTQSDVICSMDADIIAVQESRLNDFAQKAMKQEMRDKGWTLLCGKAQPPQNRRKAAASICNARHGGVAVMVRRGISAQLGPVDTVVRRRLWESGRWMHAMIALGAGHQILHVMSVYGYPGASQDQECMKSNENLMSDVFEAAAELGD